MKRSSTEILIKVMKILSSEIRSDDGVANAAITEAADRLEELRRFREFYDFVSYLIAERREKRQGRVFYDAIKTKWEEYQER